MPETLLSPETCTPNRAVYRHAVAFSTSAEAGENPQISKLRGQISSGKPPTLTLQQADACLLSFLSSQAKPGTERHVLKHCGSRMRPARQIADLGRASAVSSRPAEAGELSHGTFHRIIDSGIGLQKNSAGNNRQSLRLLFMLVSYRFSGWYFAVLPAVHDI